MRVQPPADLLGQIQAISQAPVRKRSWLPLALAASVLIAVGAAGVAWQQCIIGTALKTTLPRTTHMMEARLLLWPAKIMSDEDIEKILASLNATADKELSGHIMFIKFCPTPNGRGAHMVVSTDQGPMTIIYMPKIQVDDGEMVKFDQMQALLVNLEQGSAAIIGKQSQDVEKLVVMVRDSLKTGLVGA